MGINAQQAIASFQHVYRTMFSFPNCELSGDGNFISIANFSCQINQERTAAHVKSRSYRKAYELNKRFLLILEFRCESTLLFYANTSNVLSIVSEKDMTRKEILPCSQKSPKRKFSQVQINEPMVFWQVPPCWQGLWRGCWHSSISKRKMTGISKQMLSDFDLRKRECKWLTTSYI